MSLTPFIEAIRPNSAVYFNCLVKLASPFNLIVTRNKKYVLYCGLVHAMFVFTFETKVLWNNINCYYLWWTLIFVVVVCYFKKLTQPLKLISQPFEKHWSRFLESAKFGLLLNWLCSNINYPWNIKQMKWQGLWAYFSWTFSFFSISAT